MQNTVKFPKGNRNSGKKIKILKILKTLAKKKKNQQFQDLSLK